MIYLIEHPQCYNDMRYYTHFEQLPQWRRNIALRYTKTDDRKSCVLSFMLLKYALNKEYGILTVPRFTYNEFGKPYLPELEVFFNISHCRNAIACMVSKLEVGIDVEAITEYNHAIAQRICSHNELCTIEKSEVPQIDLTILWTQKEAISKFEGKGLSMPFSKIRTNSYSVYTLARYNYILSSCVKKQNLDKKGRDAINHIVTVHPNDV